MDQRNMQQSEESLTRKRIMVLTNSTLHYLSPAFCVFAVELLQSYGASSPLRVKVIENFLRFSVPEKIKP